MDQPDGGILSHTAFCYRGQPQYTTAIVAFIHAGLAAGEPALVAVPGVKARVIRDRLDDGPGEVVFTDMTELGRNPARIICALTPGTATRAGSPAARPTWMKATIAAVYSGWPR